MRERARRRTFGWWIMGGREREQIIEKMELLWKCRVQVARERYDAAAAHFTQMVFDSNAGLMEKPDGSFAVRDARLMESMARSEYLRVLRIFTVCGFRSSSKRFRMAFSLIRQYSSKSRVSLARSNTAMDNRNNWQWQAKTGS